MARRASTLKPVAGFCSSLWFPSTTMSRSAPGSASPVACNGRNAIATMSLLVTLQLHPLWRVTKDDASRLLRIESVQPHGADRGSVLHRTMAN